MTGLTEQINYIVDKELKTIEDARIRWDILRYRIRQYSMKYSNQLPNVEENGIGTGI